MRYVVGFMMVAFFLGGAGLFFAGVRGLARRLAARRRLRAAEGAIVRLDKRREVVIFGPLFVLAAVGIYWAFGDRIFGP